MIEWLRDTCAARLQPKEDVDGLICSGVASSDVGDECRSFLSATPCECLLYAIHGRLWLDEEEVCSGQILFDTQKIVDHPLDRCRNDSE